MKNDIRFICVKAKKASRSLAVLDSKVKDKILISMAGALVKEARHILAENERDVRLARKKNLSDALIDRLVLTDSTISSMADSLLDIASLKDPVGEVIETVKRPNGLLIKKLRVPIGVILIIYESRPNVTSDCMGLCLKSGNAVILRGGSEALSSNLAIFKVLNGAASKYDLPDGSITMIDTERRSVVEELLDQNGLIDLVMPRGGESLINYVTSRSRIPVIKHYKGVCHTFVDESADIDMAKNICFNAKVQKPGVCNAMETLLVHRRIAAGFLPSMIELYRRAGVEVRGSADVKKMIRTVRLATEKDWYTEYLDLVLSVKIVRDVGEAIAHIMKYGSYHSDAIVTEDGKNAAKFLREVDSACVYVNASTRFTDGGQFGKGAEIGISTDKLHARGPMGLEELTSYKYVIYGSGQIRK